MLDSIPSNSALVKHLLSCVFLQSCVPDKHAASHPPPYELSETQNMLPATRRKRACRQDGASHNVIPF